MVVVVDCCRGVHQVGELSFGCAPGFDFGGVFLVVAGHAAEQSLETAGAAREVDL